MIGPSGATTWLRWLIGWLRISRTQGLLLGQLAQVGTALRDISELVTLSILRKTEGGGRSTAYELAPIDLPRP